MQAPTGSLAHLTPAEQSALAELLPALRALLGPDLLEARLFGSRSRGEGHPGSDLDVALVVTGRGRARRYEAYDEAYDIGLRWGVDVALLVLERARLEELRARERLLATELDRDGVVL